MTYEEIREAARKTGEAASQAGQRVGGAASTEGIYKGRRNRRKVGEWFKNLFKGVGEDTLKRVLKSDEVQRSVDGGVGQWFKRNWYYVAGAAVGFLGLVWAVVTFSGNKSKYKK